ncbi:hypothetical protein HMPREF2815_07270 [Bacteroides sp. HMSC068A09]|jgi:hypothetical protein|nr:hypothetical protein HMPREF2815_07270 [Bacteroides sp. HMSC068A09]
MRETQNLQTKFCVITGNGYLCMNPTLKESDHEQAIPHWHTEFESLRKDGYFYVDKTALISSAMKQETSRSG